MAQLQVCGAGHRWNPTEDQRGSIDERWNRCPVCGGAVELFSLRDTRSSATSDSAHDQDRPAPSRPTDTPVIAGYEVLNTIGHGGMGVVYKARHAASGRIVALKMVSSGAHASPSELARFKTETESVRRVSHAQVVQVHDVGIHDKLPYVALEFMDRGSLAENLGGAPLPARYAAELIEMLARGVQAAHEQGILHRDLKPANILLSSPPNDPKLPTVVRLLGIPKITDFGLAKRMDGEGAMTRTGAVMGTPSYMAPEQAEGKTKAVSPTVDVHALGAMLYEALCGRPPYKGATMMETLDQVRTLEPPPPSQIVSEVPRDLSTVCMKCLQKDPDRRYSSAKALADDLRRFLDGQTIVARPMGAVERGLRWVRKRAVAIGGAAVVLAALGVAAAMYFRDRPKVEAAPAVVDDNANKVEYFAGIVNRRGVPEGVNPLRPEQVRMRDSSFRVTSRKGKVEMVEAVDQNGKLTANHDIEPFLNDDRNQPIAAMPNPRLRGPESRNRLFTVGCRWEYQRNDKGELTQESVYDLEGNLLWAFRYTAPTTGYYTDGNYPRPRAGSGAAYVALEYSPEGWTTVIRYRDHAGKARADNNGIFGKRMAHDKQGRVIRESYLGPRDVPMLSPSGYAAEERSYDEWGNVTERRFLALDGKLARSYARNGWAKETSRYDANGHLLEWRSFDVDGKPARDLGFGGPAASGPIVRFTYDEKGRRTSRAVFDADGKPLTSRGNPLAARGNLNGIRTEYRYDERGNLIEQKALDEKGELTGSYLRMKYDDQDRLIESQSSTRQPRNARPLPPELLETFSAIRMRYDEKGRMIEQSYFTGDGKPTVRNGIHRVAATLDAQGRPVAVANYDLEGKLANPVVPPLNFSTRPDRGFVGPLLPVPPPPPQYGPARNTLAWDERNNLIEIAAFDAEGKPYVLRTSNNGLFGLGGTSAFLQRWVSAPFGSGITDQTRITFRYDDRGNLLEIATFDGEGRPASSRLYRAARIAMTYDEHGKCTELSFYGPNGKLMMPTTGFGAGAGGGPGGRLFGVARTTARYDSDGRLVALAQFDADNKPLAPERTQISRQEWSYDALGNLTRAERFRADDQSLGATELTYNQFVLTSIAYRGEPTTVRRPWAKVSYQFDKSGRVAEARYEDAAGRPIRPQVVVRNGPTFARALGLAQTREEIDPDTGFSRFFFEIENDDELVKYDGKPFPGIRPFFEGKLAEEYGSTKDLQVRRGGELITIGVPSGPARITELTAGRVQSQLLGRTRLATILAGGSSMVTPVLPTDDLHGLSIKAVPAEESQ